MARRYNPTSGNRVSLFVSVLAFAFALVGTGVPVWAAPPAPLRDPPMSLRRVPGTEAPLTASSTASPTLAARRSTVRDSVEAAPLPPVPATESTEDSGTDTPSESSASRENDVQRELYPSGKVRTSREVVMLPSGKVLSHGAWRWWDESGNLVASGEFHEGKRKGTWERIYDSQDSPTFAEEPYTGFTAPFRSTADFQEGLLHGLWSIKDARGRPIVAIHYQNGVRDGVATWWNPQGQKVQQVEYRDGLLEGDFVKWDTRGDEIFRRGFHGSREILIDSTTHPNGRRRSAVTVLSAPLLPDGKDDWWTAHRALYRPEGREERQGMALQWYVNGQVRRQGDFDQDQPVGTHSWWYENGQLAARGDYIAGAPHGPWSWWFVNGVVQAQGEFDHGQPVGTWVWYREDGSQLKESKRATASPPTADRDAVPAFPKP